MVRTTTVRAEGGSTFGANKERTDMKKFAASVKQFLVSEDGPTAVEYAVMMALIIVVVIGTVTQIGTNADAKFGKVRDALLPAP